MESINIHAAKTHLSQLIERALAGEEIVISRNGKPLVDLVPHTQAKTLAPRQFGQWTGKVWFAPDYDEANATIEKMFHDGGILPKNPA